MTEKIRHHPVFVNASCILLFICCFHSRLEHRIPPLKKLYSHIIMWCPASQGRADLLYRVRSDVHVLFLLRYPIKSSGLH